MTNRDELIAEFCYEIEHTLLQLLPAQSKLRVLIRDHGSAYGMAGYVLRTYYGSETFECPAEHCVEFYVLKDKYATTFDDTQKETAKARMETQRVLWGAR